MILIAYFFFWAGILMGIGLVLYNIFNKVIAPRLAHKVSKLSKFMAATSIAQISGEYTTKEALLAKFIQEEDRTSYKQSSYNGYLAGNIFKEGLKKFFTVEILSQVCEWDKRQCAHSVKITGKGGNTFYLAFNTGIWVWRTPLRDLFQKVNADGLIVETDDEDRFEAITSLTLLHGAAIEEFNSDLQDLYAVLNMAEVERVIIPMSEERTTNVYRFAFDSNGGYYLQPTTQEIKLHTEEVVNNSYNDMDIDYEGHKQKVTPSQAMEIARIALLNRRNAFIFGKMGCGKTTFARQIMARLEEASNVRLISIAPSMIGHLQGPQAQASLVNLLSTSVEVTEFDYTEDRYVTIIKPMLNIIMIDEAETLLQKSDTGTHTEAQAFLLSMMDGELRDILNCQVLLVFNKSKEHLNTAIFRSMRGGLEFHVEPITMSRAKTLVGLLKLENINLRFDEKRFHNFITEVSLASDGSIYAAAGFTTLADVVSCFTAPELDDAIIAALRGMRMPKVTKKESKVFGFSAPKSKVEVVPANLKASISMKAPSQEKAAPIPAPANPAPPKTKSQKRRWRGSKNK